MGTAIKHLVPHRVKPSFVIFDIWALWRSALMSNDGLTRCGTRCFIDVPIWQQWVSEVNSTVMTDVSVVYLVISYADAHGSLSGWHSRRAWSTEACEKCIVSATSCKHVNRRTILSLHVVDDLKHHSTELSHVGQHTDRKLYLSWQHVNAIY